MSDKNTLKIIELEGITVGDGEILVVKLRRENPDDLARAHDILGQVMPGRFVVCMGENVELLKVQLKEHIIDKLIDDIINEK